MIPVLFPFLFPAAFGRSVDDGTLREALPVRKPMANNYRLVAFDT
jgi:hypothetical protein